MPPKKVTDPNDEPVTMGSISRLLETQKTAITDQFQMSFSSLENKLTSITDSLTDHSNRLGKLESDCAVQEERLQAAENDISVYAERLGMLETNCAGREERLNDAEREISVLRKQCSALAAKALDLESRARRCNIRIVHCPESLEGPRPTVFFAELLSEVFSDVLGGQVVEIERAHRSLEAKPAPGKPPRPVIVCLLRFQVKDKIIRHARTTKGLN